jgi:hypothetical protein
MEKHVEKERIEAAYDSRRRNETAENRMTSVGIGKTTPP